MTEAQFLSASFVSEPPPEPFLSDGYLIDTSARVLQSLADHSYVVTVVTDKQGTIRSTVRRLLDGDVFDFTDPDLDAVNLAVQLEAETWQPPILSAGVTRPTLGGHRWEVSWSVLRDAVPESFFVATTLFQFREALHDQTDLWGFAGLSSTPSRGHINSPYLTLLGMEPMDVDFPWSLPGVHWLNLIPSQLLNERMMADLYANGANIEEAGGRTLLTLRDAPSALTDQQVRECMDVVADFVHQDHGGVPDDWWRRGWST